MLQCLKYIRILRAAADGKSAAAAKAPAARLRKGKAMHTYSIYFSPTGGTKKAADILAGCFEQAETVDITVHAAGPEFSGEDICIISAPSFGGRVPGPAAERIARLKGNGAKAVLVAVYGNRAYDDTLLELKNLAIQAGFLPIAAVAAVAEHSTMRQFGTGRPDESDCQELRRFGERIREKAASGTAELWVPGSQPYREYNGVPTKPTGGAGCLSCGRCMKECPTGAIEAKNLRAVNKEKCISCMRCVSVCPQGARKVSPLLLKAAALKMKKDCSGRKKNELYL